MEDNELPDWVNKSQWNDYDIKEPEPGSEVVVFYKSGVIDGIPRFLTQIIHESFIPIINTSKLYWIDPPE